MGIVTRGAGAVLVLLMLVPPAAAAPQASGRPVAAARDTAVFAGGCFWCMETQFEGLPGVLSVVSGYTGGRTARPTYEEVSGGRTGHYEAVRVVFDPARVTYAKLVDVFWRSIDPTQADGQFCDEGSQYRTAVFFRGPVQRRLAEESKRTAERVLRRAVTTEILPAAAFHPAEDYHQDFWRKSPERYRSYRAGCRRDERTREIWGGEAARPSVH
jgi:peptide-methionine (S)-S-oxide reductase